MVLACFVVEIYANNDVIYTYTLKLFVKFLESVNSFLNTIKLKFLLKKLLFLMIYMGYVS